MMSSEKNLNNTWARVFPFKYRKIVFLVGIILFASFLFAYWYTIYFSDYYKVSINFIVNSPEIRENIGEIQEYYLQLSGLALELRGQSKGSKARLVFSIKGDRTKGEVFTKLEVPCRKWEVTHARLVLDDGKKIVLKKSANMLD